MKSMKQEWIEMSKAEKSIWKVLMLLSLCIWFTGCSVKFEALYHGKTPVGIQDAKATALHESLQPRVIRARE